jgi:hypothetical protein
LLRCFLLDTRGLCVRDPRCYVEAEFLSGAVQPQPRERPFLFGQPSLVVVSPKALEAPGGAAAAAALPRPPPGASRSGCVLDFFVRNCTLGARARGGWNVAVRIGDDLVAVLEDWAPVWIERRAPFVLRVALVNPAGEELLYPEFNATSVAVR